MSDATGARKGYTLRRATADRIWSVRVYAHGQEYEFSTGTTEREIAEKEAERIYARTLLRPPDKRPQRRRGEVGHLEVIGAEWLASMRTTHAASTLANWEMYLAGYWIPEFEHLDNMTAEACRDYFLGRLGLVKRRSVKIELAALRSFLRYCFDRGFLPEPINVPPLPKNAAGTAAPIRRRVAAIPLSPSQVEAFLAALPEWSDDSRNAAERFAIRARFLVQYETSLRPSTMDRIKCPEHYRPGEAMLRLSDDTDKVRWGRDVPLTLRAREALDQVVANMRARDLGLIFGRHDYRKHIARAAAVALPPELAGRFCAAHLRSARITHLLEKTGNIVGVQYAAGHKDLSTTSRYVRPTYRAAVEAMGLGGEPGPAGPGPAGLPENVIQFPKARSANV